MWYVISYFVCVLVFHTVVCAGIRRNYDAPNFSVFLLALVWPLGFAVGIGDGA